MERENLTVQLGDSRVMGYAEYGIPDGTVVFGMHGTPGSRLVMRLFDQTARACGVRLIAPERPGYGLSTPDREGRLLRMAADVGEMADALGLDTFAVMGASGGGPYALACLAQMPGRVRAAALVSGIGPLRAPDGLRGMAAANRVYFQLGRYAPGLVGALLRRLVIASLPGMEKQVEQGISPAPAIPPEAFAVLAADQKEAVRSGGQGLRYDFQALWAAWGFALEGVRGKVFVWHGEDDNLAPTSLARYLTANLPDCTSRFLPGEGHVEPLLRYQEEIFSALMTAG